jgi:hypothetical protein
MSLQGVVTSDSGNLLHLLLCHPGLSRIYSFFFHTFCSKSMAKTALLGSRAKFIQELIGGTAPSAIPAFHASQLPFPLIALS